MKISTNSTETNVQSFALHEKFCCVSHMVSEDVNQGLKFSYVKAISKPLLQTFYSEEDPNLYSL